MTQLVETLRGIRSLYVRKDYIDRVKAVFQDHLQALEPEATIEDTLYFNHSAIPDFKLSWNRAHGSKATRDVYLRSSYASVIAANDTESIRSGDPVFLAIDSEQTVTESGFEMGPDDVNAAASQSASTLLTDAAAVDEISKDADQDDNPLSAVIRSNFLRGARGLVDEPVAEALVHSAASHSAAPISELIRAKFLADAVFRMERTVALVEWALSVGSSDGSAPTLVPEALSGSMSTEELRAFLPWLLSLTSTPNDTKFWMRLGAMFEFNQLEELANLLEGIDLTPLVQANLSRWTARRSYLGVHISEDDDQRAADPYWMFTGGRLGLVLGAHEVRVSDSGNKLQARPGSNSPQWNTLKPRLADYSIRAVSLTGIERSFRIASQEFENINDDVDRVVETVTDNYFVEEVEVLLPGSEEDDDVAVEVNFAGGIVISPYSAQLGALTRVAANVIGNLGLDAELQAEAEDIADIIPE